MSHQPLHTHWLGTRRCSRVVRCESTDGLGRWRGHASHSVCGRQGHRAIANAATVLARNQRLSCQTSLQSRAALTRRQCQDERGLAAAKRRAQLAAII